MPLRVKLILAGRFGDDPVALDAERRREEEVGALPIENVSDTRRPRRRAEVLALLHPGGRRRAAAGEPDVALLAS
jgi:hypothetical protein